jgi:phosphatidylserine/phosphatidylglycerophosphate/cardiolipin synthase-like enzyme
MEIITNPWKDMFLDLISSSENSIKIATPFIKEDICDDIIKTKQKNSKLELITSFKLINIYLGAVDIKGIEKIIKNNGIVKNFPKLHAKIYIFDDKEAVITSSNLTNGGLINNYEFGIYLNKKDEKGVVTQTVKEFNNISNNDNVGKIKLDDINTVAEILSKIPKSNKINFPKYEIENTENKNDIIQINDEIIMSSLKGWEKDVFKIIKEIPEMTFTLKELKSYEKILKDKHPDNNNILAKIRQQLQYLRDLGIIEFLGNGTYRKLWKN